jgi:predicted DNA-binding protein (MmcQ/YjbR family)
MTRDEFNQFFYLASRGMTWIQRYDYSEISDNRFQYYIAESHRTIVLGFSRRKPSELGLLLAASLN